MSPGRPTMIVPPSLICTAGLPAGCDAAADSPGVATGAALGELAAVVQAEAASTRAATNATDLYRNIAGDSSLSNAVTGLPDRPCLHGPSTDPHHTRAPNASASLRPPPSPPSA